MRPASAASSIASAPSSPAASTPTTTTSTPTTTTSTPTTSKKPTEETTSAEKIEKRLSRRSDRVQQNKTEEKASPAKKGDKSSTDVSEEKDNSATPAAEVVSGKRERKRKKFWDEQEGAGSASKPVKSKQTPHLQHQQQQQQQQQQPQTQQQQTPKQTVAAVPVKNRRRQSTVSSADNISNNSQGLKEQKVKHSDGHVEPSGAKENGRLKYLMFDLTLDPKLIAEKMVEGLNIPGPGCSIPIDSSRLPNGWEKRVVQRGIGITKGKWDVFIQNMQNGRSFRFVLHSTSRFLCWLVKRIIIQIPRINS